MSTQGVTDPNARTSRLWILQVNPKLYAIDKVPPEGLLIYWRSPQYTEQIQEGDHALIWRAGPEAGMRGWGVFRALPAHYDVSVRPDLLWKGPEQSPDELYAPVHVWLGDYVPKVEVAALLPQHRIVTMPMGTVFPLDDGDWVTIEPLLRNHGYDLRRVPGDKFRPLPIVPVATLESDPGVESVHAKITPALFLLSSSPEQPVEITVEDDPLRMLLFERAALGSLDEWWDGVGVYLLLGKPASEGAVLSVYVGKAGGLESRIKTGHKAKDWTRCLLIQRDSLRAFNATDISWLERRLFDVLSQAPAVDLINKNPPPLEVVPEWKAEILERTVLAAVGVLGILGAYIA